MSISQSSSISVVIADDHVILLKSLSELLNSAEDITVVGEAVNGREAVEQTRLHKPDITILDLHMPEVSGIEATRQIMAEFPGAKILILSSSEVDSEIKTVMELGASAYLLKYSAPDQLINALYALTRGEGIVDSRVLQKLMRMSIKHDADALTEREMQILYLVAQGLSNQQIADKLFIAEVTVRSNVSRMLSKLNMQNRVQLATYAIRNGVISLDETDHKNK